MLVVGILAVFTSLAVGAEVSPPGSAFGGGGPKRRRAVVEGKADSWLDSLMTLVLPKKLEKVNIHAENPRQRSDGEAAFTGWDAYTPPPPLPETERRYVGRPVKKTAGKPPRYGPKVRPAVDHDIGGGGLSRFIGGILPNTYYSRPKFRYPYYDKSGKGYQLYGYGGRELYEYSVFKPLEGYF